MVQQPNGFQQPLDALQLFTADLQKQLEPSELSKKGDFDATVAAKFFFFTFILLFFGAIFFTVFYHFLTIFWQVSAKWAELSYDEKRSYYDRATAAASPIEGASSAKPKKTTNIPLPALKRFAATIASGLKEKQPHLAELQHVRLFCIHPWFVCCIELV